MPNRENGGRDAQEREKREIEVHLRQNIKDVFDSFEYKIKGNERQKKAKMHAALENALRIWNADKEKALRDARETLSVSETSDKTALKTFFEAIIPDLQKIDGKKLLDEIFEVQPMPRREIRGPEPVKQQVPKARESKPTEPPKVEERLEKPKIEEPKLPERREGISREYGLLDRLKGLVGDATHTVKRELRIDLTEEEKEEIKKIDKAYGVLKNVAENILAVGSKDEYKIIQEYFWAYLEKGLWKERGRIDVSREMIGNAQKFSTKLTDEKLKRTIGGVIVSLHEGIKSITPQRIVEILKEYRIFEGEEVKKVDAVIELSEEEKAEKIKEIHQKIDTYIEALNKMPENRWTAPIKARDFVLGFIINVARESKKPKDFDVFKRPEDFVSISDTLNALINDAKKHGIDIATEVETRMNREDVEQKRENQEKREGEKLKEVLGTAINKIADGENWIPAKTTSGSGLSTFPERKNYILDTLKEWYKQGVRFPNENILSFFRNTKKEEMKPVFVSLLSILSGKSPEDRERILEDLKEKVPTPSPKKAAAARPPESIPDPARITQPNLGKGIEILRADPEEMKESAREAARKIAEHTIDGIISELLKTNAYKMVSGGFAETGSSEHKNNIIEWIKNCIMLRTFDFLHKEIRDVNGDVESKEEVHVKEGMKVLEQFIKENKVTKDELFKMLDARRDVILQKAPEKQSPQPPDPTRITQPNLVQRNELPKIAKETSPDDEKIEKLTGIIAEKIKELAGESIWTKEFSEEQTVKIIFEILKDSFWSADEKRSCKDLFLTLFQSIRGVDFENRGDIDKKLEELGDLAGKISREWGERIFGLPDQTQLLQKKDENKINQDEKKEITEAEALKITEKIIDDLVTGLLETNNLTLAEEGRVQKGSRKHKNNILESLKQFIKYPHPMNKGRIEEELRDEVFLELEKISDFIFKQKILDKDDVYALFDAKKEIIAVDPLKQVPKLAPQEVPVKTAKREADRRMEVWMERIAVLIALIGSEKQKGGLVGVKETAEEFLKKFAYIIWENLQSTEIESHFARQFPDKWKFIFELTGISTEAKNNGLSFEEVFGKYNPPDEVKNLPRLPEKQSQKPAKTAGEQRSPVLPIPTEPPSPAGESEKARESLGKPAEAGELPMFAEIPRLLSVINAIVGGEKNPLVDPDNFTNEEIGEQIASWKKRAEDAFEVLSKKELWKPDLVRKYESPEGRINWIKGLIGEGDPDSVAMIIHNRCNAGEFNQVLKNTAHLKTVYNALHHDLYNRNSPKGKDAWKELLQPVPEPPPQLKEEQPPIFENEQKIESKESEAELLQKMRDAIVYLGQDKLWSAEQKRQAHLKDERARRNNIRMRLIALLNDSGADDEKFKAKMLDETAKKFAQETGVQVDELLRVVMLMGEKNAIARLNADYEINENVPVKIVLPEIIPITPEIPERNQEPRIEIKLIPQPKQEQRPEPGPVPIPPIIDLAGNRNSKGDGKQPDPENPPAPLPSPENSIFDRVKAWLGRKQKETEESDFYRVHVKGEKTEAEREGTAQTLEWVPAITAGITSGVASYLGVKALVDVPRAILQDIFVTKERERLTTQFDEEKWEDMDEEVIEERFKTVAEKIKKSPYLMKEQRVAILEKIKKEEEELKKDKNRYRECKKEIIRLINNEVRARVTRAQGARELSNSVLALTGFTALRAPTYGAIALFERWQTVTRENPQAKSAERLNVAIKRGFTDWLEKAQGKRGMLARAGAIGTAARFVAMDVTLVRGVVELMDENSQRMVREKIDDILNAWSKREEYLQETPMPLPDTPTPQETPTATPTPDTPTPEPATPTPQETPTATPTPDTPTPVPETPTPSTINSEPLIINTPDVDGDEIPDALDTRNDDEVPDAIQRREEGFDTDNDGIPDVVDDDNDEESPYGSSMPWNREYETDDASEGGVSDDDNEGDDEGDVEDTGGISEEGNEDTGDSDEVSVLEETGNPDETSEAGEQEPSQQSTGNNQPSTPTPPETPASTPVPKSQPSIINTEPSTQIPETPESRLPQPDRQSEVPDMKPGNIPDEAVVRKGDGITQACLRAFQEGAYLDPSEKSVLNNEYTAALFMRQLAEKDGLLDYWLSGDAIGELAIVPYKDVTGQLHIGFFDKETGVSYTVEQLKADRILIKAPGRG